MFGFWKGTKAKLLPSTGIEFSDGRIKTYASGSPEGATTATVGSEYTDTATGILYLKTSGSGNTGWESVMPSTLPVGTSIIFSGSTIPTGFLEEDGSAVSRTTYSDLFAVIGTTYGVGDGSTTFNIPDHRGNSPRGVGTSTGFTQNVTVVLGAKIDDAGQGHGHNLAQDGTEIASLLQRSGNSNFQGGTIGSSDGTLQQAISVKNPISDTVNGTPRTANETRIKSLGKKFAIKY